MVSPKINGLYDSKTISELLKLGVRSFSFDFRPQSLNFVQHYRVIEILKEVGITNDKKFTFHFGNEFAPLIEKFISDLAAEVSVTADDWSNGLLSLEFSGREDFSVMDDFEVPYRWHLYKGSNWGAAKNAKNLRGVVLPFEYLEDSFEDGSLNSLCVNLHTVFRSCEFHLERDWSSNVFSLLMDLFDFTDMSFPIDQNVEVCFRNVDTKKLASGVRPFLNISK
tara:strand:- start:419 stop:1087 length:669 start_codon:yes stop_codon:yes gene_type:complete